MSKVDAKFTKFGSRPKNFKVFGGRKISKCSRPKNFKVFEARKFSKWLEAEKISKSLRPSDLEAGQKFSKY